MNDPSAIEKYYAYKLHLLQQEEEKKQLERERKEKEEYTKLVEAMQTKIKEQEETINSLSGHPEEETVSPNLVQGKKDIKSKKKTITSADLFEVAIRNSEQ